jgi:hypothetical protein
MSHHVPANALSLVPPTVQIFDTLHILRRLLSGTSGELRGRRDMVRGEKSAPRQVPANGQIYARHRHWNGVLRSKPAVRNPLFAFLLIHTLATPEETRRPFAPDSSAAPSPNGLLQVSVPPS